MKHLRVILMAAMLLCTMSGCSQDWKPAEIVERFDDFTEKLSKTQITWDHELIGKRTLIGENCYTGEYTAECEDAAGRDVVFGGISVHECRLKVSAAVETRQGEAVFRVRLGTKVQEYTAEKGEFMLELALDGGGNYIMVDYEDFTGCVQLISEYAQ